MILSYRRTSTKEQASSLDEQLRCNRAIATMRGVKAFEFADYSDFGVSGSVALDKRPQGSLMLKDAQAGDVIVATKLDRLFRSAQDALRTLEILKGRGIELILVDLGVEPVNGKGVGKLVFGILSQIAEFERDRIRERIAEGKAAKAARGGHTGGAAPYGYVQVGIGKHAVLKENPEEAAMLEEARDLARRGTTLFVLRCLTSRGYRNRKGNPLHITQVQRMINRFKAEERAGIVEMQKPYIPPVQHA